MVCASYATVVIYTSGPLTWALVLPPVTVTALFIIEYVVICIYNFLLNFTETCTLDNVTLRKSSFSAWIQKSFSKDCITLLPKKIGKCAIFILSLTFEAHSVQCLITSYSYLLFAVAINTVWISDPKEYSGTTYAMIQTTLIALQYLAFASLLLNIFIVQWEGKNKARCIAYSVIFLILIVGIYFWVKNDFESY
ncbi:unnamed protein product, partial [Meganyctiphanes norvegica]